MRGRIIPTFLEKGQRVLGIGSPPTFCPFMVSLGPVMVSENMSFSMLMHRNKSIIRLKCFWNSNLQPSWATLVITSFVVSSMAASLLQ